MTQVKTTFEKSTFVLVFGSHKASLLFTCHFSISLAPTTRCQSGFSEYNMYAIRGCLVLSFQMFTRRLFPGEHRSGYELLGLLLMLQVVMELYQSLASTNADSKSSVDLVLSNAMVDQSTFNTGTANTTSSADNNVNTQCQVAIDLVDDAALPYIPAGSRRCPLCLDPMKDPTAAECGHLFCWTCILRWTGESAGQGECPICRGRCGREALLRLAS